MPFQTRQNPGSSGTNCQYGVRIYHLHDLLEYLAYVADAISTEQVVDGILDSVDRWHEACLGPWEGYSLGDLARSGYQYCHVLIDKTG